MRGLLHLLAYSAGNSDGSRTRATSGSLARTRAHGLWYQVVGAPVAQFA
jgi:hypothetical protein